MSSEDRGKPLDRDWVRFVGRCVEGLYSVFSCFIPLLLRHDIAPLELNGSVSSCGIMGEGAF